MRHDALFFAGIISDSIESELIKREVNYYDYYKNKQFLILNSHLTALAAIKLISPDDETRYINKNVLITGYGYLAQALANCCDELGMNVSLIARKPKNRADAQEHGFDVYDFPIYEDMLKKFDYIFNTVPSKIFSKENISRLNRDTVFVELASKPYGTDPSYFISFSKEYICAQSLPGKYYPKECAKGIFDALINHLTNDGDEH